MKNVKVKNNKKAFFFLRHNNDIDHIAPVLYKWLSTEDVQTNIIITTNPSLLNDYRINYLGRFENVRIFHINDLFKKHSPVNVFNKYYFKYNTEADNFIRRSSVIRKKSDKYIKKIANSLFKDVNNGIVVFDWISTYFVRQITKLAKERGFTTISLPHGDRPHVSLLEGVDSLDYSYLNQYKSFEMFDYLVVPNKLTSKRYDRFISEDKLKILGSPRYCDEWLNIISKFIPSFEIKESKNKLKIVLFLRNTGYPIFWEEVMKAIQLIIQFENVYLIVKHHPRNRTAKKLTEKLISSSPEVKQKIGKNLRFIYTGVDSGSLLKWADLIIDIGTSVTWDAVKQNKPVLMLEYLNANHSTIAYYMKNTEMKCRDDLYHAIEKMKKNKKAKFYNEAERKRFIKEIIDVPDEYVLERYCKFLKSCFK